MTRCIPASGWKDPAGDFVEEGSKGRERRGWGSIRGGHRPECGQTWEEKLFCIKEGEFRISLDSLENPEEWGVSREVHKPCVDCGVVVVVFFYFATIIITEVT